MNPNLQKAPGNEQYQSEGRFSTTMAESELSDKFFRLGTSWMSNPLAEEASAQGQYQDR